MAGIGFKPTDNDAIAKKRERRSFRYHDNGKDRGEDWRHPIIKLRTQTGLLGAKFDKWYAENRHLSFERAEKLWRKRLDDADVKTPGVPSDLLNYRYTGDFYSLADEEYDIAEAKAGDPRALDRLVKRFQPLIGKIIRGDKKSRNKKKRKRYYGVPDEELVAIAETGLVKAFQLFKPDRGRRFSTFAEYKIRGALDDALRGSNQAERALFARPNATPDELVELSGLSTNPRFIERTRDLCADAIVKRDAEASLGVYDTIETGLPQGSEDTEDWANFGDNDAPGRGDSDNTAHMDRPSASPDLGQYYVEPDTPEPTSVVLSEADLAAYRRNDNPHLYRTPARNLDELEKQRKARARLAARIDTEVRIERHSAEWFAAGYPRFRPRTKIDIIPNDPITSCLSEEETYHVAEGTTLVPSQGSELTRPELARTSGDES